jgi:hypothetical protein
MPLSNVSEHVYDCCHCSNHSSAFGCFLCSFGDMLLCLPEISITLLVAHLAILFGSTEIIGMEEFII